MKIVRVKTDMYLVKAITGNIMEKNFSNSTNKVVIQNKIAEQILPADNQQIVSIENEPVPIAYIIQNGDV